MFDLHAALLALAAIAVLAVAGWLLSVVKRDVSIVDSLWSLFFLLAVVVYAVNSATSEPRATIVLILVTLWALRLAGYLTWRNWGEPEDRRYQAIRARNEPGFAWKSLYLVFGLQGVLMWIVSWPLQVGQPSAAPPNWLDVLGVLVWGTGWLLETITAVKVRDWPASGVPR